MAGQQAILNSLRKQQAAIQQQAAQAEAQAAKAVEAAKAAQVVQPTQVVQAPAQSPDALVKNEPMPGTNPVAKLEPGEMQWSFLSDTFKLAINATSMSNEQKLTLDSIEKEQIIDGASEEVTTIIEMMNELKEMYPDSPELLNDELASHRTELQKIKNHIVMTTETPKAFKVMYDILCEVVRDAKESSYISDLKIKLKYIPKIGSNEIYPNVILPRIDSTYTPSTQTMSAISTIMTKNGVDYAKLVKYSTEYMVNFNCRTTSAYANLCNWIKTTMARVCEIVKPKVGGSRMQKKKTMRKTKKNKSKKSKKVTKSRR